MHHFDILNRRAFLDRSFKIGLGVALSTLVDIPFVMKRALAEGTIGLDGKKLLFIFLRGANDAINSVIPIQDSAYNDDTLPNGLKIRPNIAIPKDGVTNYSTLGGCDYPSNPLYGYGSAIRLGNGFAALHPSLKYLAPVYNAGDLALIHRVGYPKQSRSHFDSQNYWENGNPNNKLSKDGVFYRTMMESGLAGSQALTGVSIQSGLPLLLRGSAAAMTNLTDPLRYNLLGIPNTAAGNTKADAALRLANGYPFPDKKNRDLLQLQYQNLNDTLSIFAGLNFGEDATPGDPNRPGNVYTDDETGYYLFPTRADKNAGQVDGSANAYSFFTNLKAAALILNKTDAIIAGTEIGGSQFDTHVNQGGTTGAHPNLQTRIGWALYALRKYFMNYADQTTWNDVVVVTLSEFGRTSKQNSTGGTDHAEAGLMFVAGGAVKGFSNPEKITGNASGVFGCSPNDSIPWVTGLSGSMFALSGNYLKRTVDYRSILGKLIRDHLGATQAQLDRIIPGYADSGEHLQQPGPSSIDNTPITGELNII